MIRRPSLTTLTLTLADTEYSYEFPAWVKQFSVKARTDVAVRIAYVTGKVAVPTDPYQTISAGCEFEEDNILGAKGVPLKVYFASSSAGMVLEISMGV